MTKWPLNTGGLRIQVVKRAGFTKRLGHGPPPLFLGHLKQVSLYFHLHFLLTMHAGVSGMPQTGLHLWKEKEKEEAGEGEREREEEKEEEEKEEEKEESK